MEVCDLRGGSARPRPTSPTRRLRPLLNDQVRPLWPSRRFLHLRIGNFASATQAFAQHVRLVVNDHDPPFLSHEHCHERPSWAIPNEARCRFRRRPEAPRRSNRADHCRSSVDKAGHRTAARAKGDADRRLHAGADLFRRGERLTGPVSPSRLRLGVDCLTAVGGFVCRGVKG